MRPTGRGLKTRDVAEKSMEHGWNDIDRGQPKYSHKKKTCPNATLLTTNPACTAPKSNPSFRVWMLKQIYIICNRGVHNVALEPYAAGASYL